VALVWEPYLWHIPEDCFLNLLGEMPVSPPLAVSVAHCCFVYKISHADGLGTKKNVKLSTNLLRYCYAKLQINN
jgi:hypothetical protein